MSHVTGGIFQSSSTVALESPTVPKITSKPLTRQNTPPTLSSEPSQEEPQDLVAKPSRGSHDDLDVATYPHLSKCHNSPPVRLPRKKRRGFKYYVKLKLPWLFGRPSTVRSARRTENTEAKDVTSVSQDEDDSVEHRELETFSLPQIHALSSNKGGILRPPSELASPNPLPSNLAEIITESRRWPNQDLIDRIDAVCHSSFHHLCTRLI